MCLCLCLYIIFILADSLEHQILEALDLEGRERRLKAAGLVALPNRHIGCRVTARVRDVSASAFLEDCAAVAKCTPFLLQVFGVHHSACSTKLRCVQHLDPDMRTWCKSLMRLRMNETYIREAIDEFLIDRAAFSGTFLCWVLSIAPAFRLFD